MNADHIGKARLGINERRATLEHQLTLLREHRYGSRDELAEVINYVLAGEGKRVRGLLTLLCAEVFSGDYRHGLIPAMAVEMVHAYSLVHDDLPCMDNDDMRRGRLTAHKMFGDAKALLAGDALLTDAFYLLTANTNDKWHHPVYCGAEGTLGMVRELSDAAGGKGMVLGQTIDLSWTGKSEKTPIEVLDQMHSEKTGALIGAACALGALAGGAQFQEAQRLRQFGRELGLSYQIVDDLLDSEVTTGKSAGKDLAQGKSTYATIMTIDACRDRAAMLTRRAHDFLAGLHAGSNANIMLRLMIDDLLTRNH